MVRKNSQKKPNKQTKAKNPNNLKIILFIGVLIILLVILSIVIGKDLTGYAAKAKITYINCSETDSGKNIYVAGSLTAQDNQGNITDYTDSCQNKIVKKKTKNGTIETTIVGVLESYCNKKVPVQTWYQCKSGVCENGACTRLCSDTDAKSEIPNGYNINITGTMTFQNQVKVDACNPKKANVLHEWYCDLKNDVSKQQPVKCSLGCKDGACVQPYTPPAPCKETDNGKDTTLKGVLTYETKDYTDICANEYAISIPKSGKLKITYLGSSASLVSGFFMDSDTEPIEIFKENKKLAQNTVWETTYKQGDKLNFFIRVYGNPWGIGTYDHYAIGQLDPWTNKSYAIITQISDVKWKIGFEDLPGNYQMHGKGAILHSDWDFNDEVVEIELIAPDGGWVDENPEACTGTKTATSVLEYYCENQTKKCEFIECPLGCQDGACKQPVETCSDSDGKKNFDTIGTCTDSTGTYNDGCSTNYIQKDYYCESDKCTISTKSCPAGSVCNDGKCEYVPTTCDATAYTYKVGDSYYLALDLVGTCNEDIVVGYSECKCPTNIVDTLGGTQYDGYCTEDASVSSQSHLGCHLCVSKAMTFTAGNYAARKAFDFASCGTSQIDLMDRTSTVGLKFT
ncbi:MAG: hypothetical protein PHE43_04690, partial [Candidatus Nanoarchaeia archaeon]|nr:hypothetical protein [Candidatus Nanoarchaeia archaeon]